MRSVYLLGLRAWCAALPLWIWLKYVDVIPLLPDTILKQLFLAFLLVPVLAVLRERNWQLELPTWFLLFFGVLIVHGVLVSPIQFPQWIRSYTEGFVLLTLPILIVSPDRAEIESIVRALVLGLSLTCIVAVANVLDPSFLVWPNIARDVIIKGTPPNGYLGPRLQSITGNPNNLATLAVLTAVLGGTIALDAEEARAALFAYGVAALGALITFLTRSRDDIGILAVSVVLVAVLSRNVKVLVIGGLGLFAGFLANYNQVVLVFRRLLERGNPRFDFWAEIIGAYWPTALVGIGYLPNDAWAVDSTFIKIFVELGVVGILIFAIANFSVAVPLYSRAKQGEVVELQLLLTFFALAGTMVVRVSLFNTPFSHIYWLFIGLGIVSTPTPLENEHIAVSQKSKTSSHNSTIISWWKGSATRWYAISITTIVVRHRITVISIDESVIGRCFISVYNSVRVAWNHSKIRNSTLRIIQCR